MTKIDDDILLKQFFNENRQEIADNGFTERVMKRLPGRANRLANILMAVGVILAVILFFVLDGLGAILSTLREVFVSMSIQGIENVDLKSLVIAGGVLLFFGVQKIYSMEW